jgi:mycothiol synthase
MVEVRVHQPIAPDDLAAVRSLAAEAALADGYLALGDAVWRDLAHPATDSALLVAEDGGNPVGVLHLAGDDRFTAQLVVEPEHRGAGVETALLEAATEHVRGHLHLWVFGVDDDADALARAAGFGPVRDLWQMTVPLPLSEAPAWPPGIQVRTFQPGRDEAEWLAVNNRAFASDPDQGEWSLATLQEREAEPWFDPSGFLLAVDDAGIAGFCWTKVHEAAPPLVPEPMGEIYVIGVDPDGQGAGLGRALAIGGLASLAGRGLGTGMLFVDAANDPAVELYGALGFATTRVDRSFARDVS